MNQRPTLDPSTFEGLLAAAWVLQCQREQEAHNHRPAPGERLTEPPETRVEPHCVSERDTTNARLMATLSELSKAANTLRVSRRVRCAKCDNESDSRRRFCDRCGARLLEPRTTPQTEPPAPSKPNREQIPPVGGSSLLLPGLANEMDSSFGYQFEGDVSTSHWGRGLVLVVLLGCVATAVWHWRRDLRDWAVRFSHRPGAIQPKQVSYRPGTPVQAQAPASGTLLNTTSASKMDAQSAMYQNQWTPTNHKIQGPEDGIWVKTATKPSPEIPFDSVTMATRHYVRGVASTRPTTGVSVPGRDRDVAMSGTVRADSVAPAWVSRENPPAASSAVDAPQAAPIQNSGSQMTRDAQSSRAAGNRQNAASNPSSGRPIDSVPMATRYYVPRPPPGARTANIAAKAGHAAARLTSAGGPLVNQSKSEPVQWATSRYVPRPPWSSSNGRTTEPSVPRPPARWVPRTP